jgi:hypothetical protein
MVPAGITNERDTVNWNGKEFAKVSNYFIPYSRTLTRTQKYAELQEITVCGRSYFPMT